MTSQRRFTLLFAGAIFAAGFTFGQPMAKGKMGMMNYDPAKEITIQGTVESIKEGPGMMMGVHATVKVATGKIENVALGPAKFLEEKKFKVTKGDEITVTGVPMGRNGMILALVIKKGEISLDLRDVHGVPAPGDHSH